MKAFITGLSGSFIVLWLLAVIGWILNIFQVVGLLSEPITTLVVCKLVGVFIAPFGAILGWIGIF